MIRTVTSIASVSALVLSVALSAKADLVSDFKMINGGAGGKGPFGQNVLQGEKGRTPVLGGLPPGVFYFQAAYRNENAQALAANNDFYVGNLFTTNFYELMGEYVYGNANSDHGLDHIALLQNGAKALPKASSMVRHWVLEKHYVRMFTAQTLSRSFLLRGISDFTNEQTFATYFLDFYMATIVDEYQYLPAYLLAKGSPIVSSSSLEKARVDVANLYDSLKLSIGEKDPGVVKLYKLRNAIHNQLSVSVIHQIEVYVAAYPTYGKDTLLAIRDSLKAYYSTNAKKVADLAKKVPAAAAVVAVANGIVANGANPANLLALSNELAKIRTEMLNEAVITYNHKTPALVLLTSGSQFVNKEINSMPTISSKDVIKALVNLVYIEGFLIKDNWMSFLGDIDKAPTTQTAAMAFADITDIANDTLLESFRPSYEQWLQVEPSMQSFLDNTLKSSALNTASTILNRIK